MLKTVSDPKQIAEDFRRLAMGHQQILALALEKTITDTIGPETLMECPFDTGTLRRSWTIEPALVSGSNLSIRFGYGTYYAIYVHEILENYHAPPTKAKFLEDPVNRNRNVIPERVITLTYELMGGS